MYFASRMQAGRMLAAQIAKKYADEPCAVLAISEGGVMVGAQIAQRLKCVLTFLPTAELLLPREPEAIGGITAGGALAYNHRYSQGEIDEELAEYYNFIEQQKMNAMSQLNALMGKGGTVEKRLLSKHNVIIVADGLKSAFPLDLALEFLKPVATKKLIAAVPFASVAAVDRMHVAVDDIFCLSVIEDYIDTDHYYDVQDIPDKDTIIETIGTEVAHWR